MQPYLWSHCLNVFKVASILLKSDGSLVEEPLERHIQWSVMCGLTAQHHTLSYGHLHHVRAKLHTHGICKHKTAALSPQANPDFPLRCSIWLWTAWKSENESQTETKRTFNIITLKSSWGLVHVCDLHAVVCPCVIWFFSVRAFASRVNEHNKFPSSRAEEAAGGGGLTLGSVSWWRTFANLAENKVPPGHHLPFTHSTAVISAEPNWLSARHT